MYIINIKFNFRPLRYLLILVFNNTNNLLPGIDRQLAYLLVSYSPLTYTTAGKDSVRFLVSCE